MSFAVPHYLDASVAVKLVCKEPDSARIDRYVNGKEHWAYEFYITESALYETLGVLKRKWVKEELTEEQYFSSVSVLDAYLRERIHVDQDFRPADRSILLDLRDLVKRHSIDYSDALQIYAVLNGKTKGHVEECKTVLVTADKGLVKASLAEGLRVWHYPNGDTPDE